MFSSINIVNPMAMIPVVAIAGFLDGIHPCAIAILIFFIGFLLTLQRAFKNIFFLGSVFILMVFLIYLAVGVGLFSGIVFFGIHHFFAKLGAWLLIFLGLINSKDFFFLKFPIHFGMPKFATQK